MGSILAVPDSLNDPGRLEGYQVEGIGYDFIPTVSSDAATRDRTWIVCIGARQRSQCDR